MQRAQVVALRSSGHRDPGGTDAHLTLGDRQRDHHDAAPERDPVEGGARGDDETVATLLAPPA